MSLYSDLDNIEVETSVVWENEPCSGCLKVADLDKNELCVDCACDAWKESNYREYTTCQ